MTWIDNTLGTVNKDNWKNKKEKEKEERK